MKNPQQRQYLDYKKPSWAPPSWIFAWVWSVLYVIIAISYIYVAYLFGTGVIPGIVLLPFALNLIFNFAYTPIQFGLRNFLLGAIDVVLVVATLIWALVWIYPVAPWVAYVNIPYLVWGSFATALQITITAMNRKK